jgi:hypothetical protein
LSDKRNSRSGWLTGRPGSGAPGRRTLGAGRKSPEHLQALEQVKLWTRERFALTADEIIVVSEVPASFPGSPPLMTIVVFWTADRTRHHFRLFKPVSEVAREDLPFAWMRDALAVAEGFECSCC